MGSIGIRFSKTTIPDLNLPLPSPGTRLPVAALKKQVRKLRPADTARRRLRLIYAGRVLPDADDLALIIDNLRQQHQQGGKINNNYNHGATASEPVVLWLNCSVGDALSDVELALEFDTGVQPAPSTLPQPIGFDRLRSAGFSEQDIAQLRIQFNRLHGGLNNNNNKHDDATRQLEERWMNEGATAQDTLPDGSPVGVYEDLLFGTVVGFFLGFIALFFLREGSMFSKRQQMAIIAGIIINISFAILRMYY
ncbi:DUF2407 C-terminal domain-containing protein [Lipomyces japonicus]|uniref:DUF2407 C-terminal domain-containing protein n=1 Tax=Lipomyces japonicus TaxID=56871 RepID=UPI0034CE2D07